MANWRLMVPAAGLALMLTASPGFAACNNGVCATGVEKGKYLHITLSSQSSPYTHYNFRNVSSGGSQEEHPAGHPVVKVYIGTSKDDTVAVRFRYAVQVCNRGGTFSRSSCRPWANFVHTMTTVGPPQKKAKR